MEENHNVLNITTINAIREKTRGVKAERGEVKMGGSKKKGWHHLYVKNKKFNYRMITSNQKILKEVYLHTNIN